MIKSCMAKVNYQEGNLGETSPQRSVLYLFIEPALKTSEFDKV